MSPLHDRPLDQIRMLNHHCDELAIAELVLAQSELFVCRFTLSQKISRLQVHFTKQLREFLLTHWLNVVIDFLVRNAALTEQLVHLSTLGSSWFFVNCDCIRHNYGKIPLTLVASTTLPTASIYAPVRMSVL